MGCRTALQYFSLHEFCTDRFLWQSVAAKKVMLKICLASKLKAIRKIEVFGVIQLFNFSVQHRTFFIVEVNCHKKSYVKNLHSPKTEGDTKNLSVQSRVISVYMNFVLNVFCCASVATKKVMCCRIGLASKLKVVRKM